MTTIVRLTIATIIMTGFLFGAAFEKRAQSRNATVTISSDKPLSTGSNSLKLNIAPKDKTSIEKVEIKAFMPAMPGMPAMESRSTATPAGEGRYEAIVTLAMSGTWQIHIFLTPKSGKKIRVKTSVNVN